MQSAALTILSCNSFTFSLFTINNVLTNPRRNIPEHLNLKNKGPREWVPFFLSNDQETPSPERYEHNGRNELGHHLTGKLFPQGRDIKQCSPS
jgi:hypothetical protein